MGPLAGGESAAAADHHMRVDRVSSRPKRVLIVVANPGTSTTVGWPVGFWGAELTHPYFELTQRGVEVTIASPEGGRVEMDALSDPRDESQWSADDLITMGFLHTPELTALLQDTPKLADLDLGDYDAIMVAGGQAPMFSFRGSKDVHNALRRFYEAEKRSACTATALRRWSTSRCPTAATWWTARPSPGLPTSRRIFSDTFVGQKVMPFRVEDELRQRGANYVQGGLFKAFAVRTAGSSPGSSSTRPERSPRC
jgi:putative intracellular protease/amidase